MANKTINQLTAVASVVAADEIEVQKAGETGTKKATVSQLTAIESAARIAQDDVIEASAGLNADGTYPSLANSWYLRAADFLAGITDRSGAVAPLTENIINALRMLDSRLSTTYSAIPTWLKTKTQIISTAEILACNAVPVVILPAEAGKVHDIIGIVVQNNYGGTAFEAGTDKLEFKYSGGLTMFELPNAFIEESADAMYKAVATANQKQSINADVVMYCATAPTLGNGGFVVHIIYRTILAI